MASPILLTGFFNSKKNYFTKAGVSWKIAVAVFEVGRLELSPRDHMFGYFWCLKVKSSTSTNPAKFARPDYVMKDGALMGGTKCKKSNSFSSLYFVIICSKIAFFSVTSTKLCSKVTLIPRDFA